MKAYTALTVRGQARRLRALAWDALRHYALDVRRLRLVTNDFNGIFRLDTAQGDRFILRITLPEGTRWTGGRRCNCGCSRRWRG